MKHCYDSGAAKRKKSEHGPSIAPAKKSLDAFMHLCMHVVGM